MYQTLDVEEHLRLPHFAPDPSILFPSNYTNHFPSISIKYEVEVSSLRYHEAPFSQDNRAAVHRKSPSWTAKLESKNPGAWLIPLLRTENENLMPDNSSEESQIWISMQTGNKSCQLGSLGQQCLMDGVLHCLSVFPDYLPRSRSCLARSFKSVSIDRSNIPLEVALLAAMINDQVAHITGVKDPALSLHGHREASGQAEPRAAHQHTAELDPLID
ncbi:hypothetical protein RRG08_022423 [Elysia crispata]|uniref:Uncharacterized protein n=1 Tax=Elysia crispata TaxID=231223 RepID=A0AAE0Z2E0_9GAST|nr:hypothetical protein RRG08_022423 [Elysia crispata]